MSVLQMWDEEERQPLDENLPGISDPSWENLPWHCRALSISPRKESLDQLWDEGDFPFLMPRTLKCLLRVPGTAGIEIIQKSSQNHPQGLFKPLRPNTENLQS